MRAVKVFHREQPFQTGVYLFSLLGQYPLMNLSHQPTPGPWLPTGWYTPMNTSHDMEEDNPKFAEENCHSKGHVIHFHESESTAR